MTIYPNVAALLLCNTMRNGLVDGRLRLFKSILSPLSVSTNVADFVQANFTGYTQGSVPLMNQPYLDPAGGATISTPAFQFQFAAPTPPAAAVTNVIEGWYFLTESDELIVAGTFDEPIAMAALGDAIPLQVLLNFGRN